MGEMTVKHADTEVATEVATGNGEPAFDAVKRKAALAIVRKFGDPALRAPALRVERFDGKLHAEVMEMKRIMDDAMGVGLAATQLGIVHRVLVYRAGAAAALVALVNPEIEWRSADLETGEEGCLSLPGVTVDVERPLHVRVRGHDTDGAGILVEASGLEARVIQHEVDHLEGMLIIDRTTKEQRREAMRVLREWHEAGQTAPAA